MRAPTRSWSRRFRTSWRPGSSPAGKANIVPRPAAPPSFLREQIAKLSRRLGVAEENLRIFRERAGVVSLPDEASTGVMRAGELQAKRNALEAERAALAELVERVRGIRWGADSSNGLVAYRSLVAFPTLLQNEAMSQLEIASLAQIGGSPFRAVVPTLTAGSRRAAADQPGQRVGAAAPRSCADLSRGSDQSSGGAGHRAGPIPCGARPHPEKGAAVHPAPAGGEGPRGRGHPTAIPAEGGRDRRGSRRPERAAGGARGHPPTTPSSPKPLLNAVVALVFGIGLGIAGAFLRE